MYFLSTNELTDDGESLLGTLKSMFGKKTIDSAVRVYRSMERSGESVYVEDEPARESPRVPRTVGRKIPKRIPRKGGGGVARLGRINKKFNIDVTEERVVKKNLESVSRDVLKKVLKVYRRAKKTYPKEEDIGEMEQYITQLFTRPNKVRSIVKRSMK